MAPNDWSVDGHLVFMDFAKGAPVLAIYSARDRSFTQFAGESEAQFSPDGKWIVYAGPRGHLSGEIFVQPFPGAGARLQISSSGGGQPRWSRDGKRIFYLTSDRKLMAATFDPRRFSAARSGPQLCLLPVRRCPGRPLPHQLVALWLLLGAHRAHQLDRATETVASFATRRQPNPAY
jgi:hypothetical protein